jgi:hypothetical protein
MHLICNLSDIWSLYNGTKMTSKPLTPHQIEVIKEIFGDDIKENSLYNTLYVVPIAPNKVEQLMAKPTKPQAPAKKAA